MIIKQQLNIINKNTIDKANPFFFRNCIGLGHIAVHAQWMNLRGILFHFSADVFVTNRAYLF